MSDETADIKLAFAPDGATHDVTSAQPHDADCSSADFPAADFPTDHTSDFADDYAAATPPPRDGLKRTTRALLKPLIAIATAQYVIVTALVAFTAVMVASEAAKVINATFDPIIAALKRF